MTEPKKETVSPPSPEKRDPTRIVLPTRTPVPRLPPKIMPSSAAESPLLRPLPKPPGIEPSAPVIITTKPLPRVDAIPRALCWGLFALSTVIFLIQIWNYVVS